MKMTVTAKSAYNNSSTKRNHQSRRDWVWFSGLLLICPADTVSH